MRLSPEGERLADEVIRRYRAGESIQSIANELTEGDTERIQLVVAMKNAQEERR